MRLVITFIFLLFTLSTKIEADPLSEMITAYCPNINELTKAPLTNSWAKYRYSGQSPVNLPEVNNVLYFTGDSTAESANYFYGATWTDRTFLCLYNYNDDPIVMYESQLDPFVEKCYFGKPGINDCHSSNPNDCPITCEPGMPSQI
jgi:hypothetical protein